MKSFARQAYRRAHNLELAQTRERCLLQRMSSKPRGMSAWFCYGRFCGRTRLSARTQAHSTPLPDAPPRNNCRQVFVDVSRRRRRWVYRLCYAFAIVCLGYFTLLVSSVLGSLALDHSPIHLPDSGHACYSSIDSPSVFTASILPQSRLSCRPPHSTGEK